VRVVIAFALATAAIGCKSDPTCLLEDVITARVGAQELHDCGTADATTPIATVQAIHDCVIADQTAHTPFRAEVVTGDGGAIELAWIGVTEGGVWKVYYLAHVEDMYTDTFACSVLDEDDPCSDDGLRGGLCLTCTGQATVDSCPGE
jgi:hypothetical protein